MLLILMLAREAVYVVSWVDGEGCVVLKYFWRERN